MRGRPRGDRGRRSAEERPVPLEPRPREFSARLTRRARARAVAAERRRRHAGRRLALLGLAVAAPAFAAPDGWNALAGTESRPMAMPVAVPVERIADAPAPPAAALFDAGPAARARPIAGSPRDQHRARECLTMAIYYEAGSESEAGQRAVAQVVLNRVAHPAWPATVCGVVFQGSERASGCQFTFTCDGSLARAPSPLWWNRAARVARAALAGAVHTPVGLATHYHTVDVHPYWADSLHPVGTIGAHRFYRWRGAAGRPDAFHARYRGGEPLAALYRGNPAAIDAAPAIPVEALAVRDEPAAAPSPIPSPDLTAALPAAGTVRPEYARSGEWLGHATRHGPPAPSL